MYESNRFHHVVLNLLFSSQVFDVNSLTAAIDTVTLLKGFPTFGVKKTVVLFKGNLILFFILKIVQYRASTCFVD